MHFCTNCRAAHHGVVLKVTVPIKHLSFPLLPPQGGIDEGGMHSKKISLILQGPPLWTTNLREGGWLVGQVWVGSS